MMTHMNAIHNFVSSVRFGKLILTAFVLTAVISVVCWRWLRPVHATVSAGAPVYAVSFESDPAAAGTAITISSNGASGVLTLGEQDGVLTYTSSAAGPQADLNDQSATPENINGVALAQVTKVTVNGGSGNDTLIINNPQGSLLAPHAVIEFDGGDGYDTLVIQGGGGPDTHVTYTPGPTQDAGLIETTNGQDRQVIRFSGLEPVQDNVPAATATVNGNSANNVITYSKGTGGGIFAGNTGLVAVDSNETYEFNNKAKLILNGSGGSDIINLNNATTPAGLTSIVTDPATVNLSAAVGPVTVTMGDNTPGSSNPNTVITGYGPPVTVIGTDTVNMDVTNKSFTATGTTQNDNIIYTPTGATAGTFYDNIASGNNLVPNTVFNFANVSGNFKVFNDPGGNADHVTLRGTAARDLFEINQGNGIAQVLSNNITALLPVELGISAEILDVEGVGGENTFQVIPGPGIAGQAQDNMLININGGTTGADNSLVLGSSFGASPGTLAANNFVVINKNPEVNSGSVRDFVNAVANPDINYKNVQVVSPNVFGGNLNPNLLVIGPDLNEPNEQLGNAAFLGSAGTIQVSHATIFPPNPELPGTPPDNDYYRVLAQNAGPLTVKVFFRTFNPSLLPAGGSLNLEVLNASGTVLATGITQATIQATAGQSYYLHVFGAASAAVNGYDLLISNLPLTVTGKAFNAVEGVSFSNQIVGSFATSAPLANFTATINWGDGTASSSGVIVAAGPGAFNILGGHTYTEEGSFNVVVQVTDVTNGTTQQGTGTATVADAPLSVATQTAGSSTTFSGTGGNNSAGGAFNAMSAFQAAIGGINNGGIPSPQNGGFRTINWDGVGLTATDGTFINQVIVPNHVVGIPLNRFQERGMNFSEIYAVADDGFTSVNPGVAGQFPAFSSPKTFAMFNDNSIDFNFVLPSVHGANVPIQAVTKGFGAIFVDVETPNTTSIEYFNGTTSLGKFFVPVGATGQPEFFGVLFQNAVVTNVEITLGNATLFGYDGTNVFAGPADAPPGTDLAVTDDFVYPEPQSVSTGINLNAIVGAPFTARVASFTDADPNGQASDYSVVIDWGDGTTSAGGVTPNAAQPDSGTITDNNASITPSVNGGWDVVGTHTYASAGSFTITTSIRDIGGASISATSTAAVTGQPTLSINNVTVAEGNNGTTNAQFTVTLSGASSQTVTVDYVTADGTATAPSDYDAQAGTVSFAPGVTTRTINVPVKSDTLPEPNENFFVNLFNPVNASIAVAQGTATINDDDESGFVQFSASTATVSEAGPTVTLTITRTGDTSGVTTVNFETSDGTALQKSDYTFNSGVVQFNPGETSKTIKISIVDDVFVEGSETFKVTLSNVSGNFVINNPNQVTVTITDNDSVPPVSNPIDDSTFFVRQQYLDFLGREPDAPGLTFWTNQIAACGSDSACIAGMRVNVSAAFFLSIEYQETSGDVIRTQRVAFSRQSNDPNSRLPYLQFMRETRQVGAGVIVGQPGFDTLLEQNKQAYATQIVNSAAFLARFPIMPAANYVDALYASAAVTPTAAERTAAINAFGAGGTAGRVAALRSVSDSNSVRQAELIPSFVLAEYFGYLRRNPTDAPDFNDLGYQFWLAKLNAFNGDFVKAEMVKAFITSGEYRQRFGP